MKGLSTLMRFDFDRIPLRQPDGTIGWHQNPHNALMLWGFFGAIGCGGPTTTGTTKPIFCLGLPILALW